MDPASDIAPPVVTVTIVYEPGPWFDESLDALAEQDYSNLKHLFLVAGDVAGLPERIRARVPNAFVRALPGNIGFGPACNEVLGLVQGDNGFFCMLHDDVALDPGAIRLMVEELYRSNAGVVGPKLVEWSDPGILQHVGLYADRFGEIDPVVETGEVDQEQHDAVRDVFAVPSACMLIRADLFRAIGGFPPGYTYYGEDLDLCWRAHLNGARVVVVPSARARHLERLVERRPDLPHERLRAQNRVHSVATLTGGRRVLPVSLQLIALSVAEFVIGLFTGRARDSWETIKALIGTFGRVPAVFRARRAVAPLREVPDSEVAGLQVAGSARVRSYLRRRGGRSLDAEATSERRWRESAGSAPFIVWMFVLGMLLLGSRRFIIDGVPRVGEFLAYPDSPRDMASQYWSGWWHDGLGSSSHMPTAVGLIAAGSVLALFRMGLWHTMAVIGTVVAGYVGVWRLAGVYFTPRARLVTLLSYALMPLPSAALSFGKWRALAVYAAMPWFVYLVRRAAGIEVLLDDERLATVDPRRRVRLLAQLVLVCGLAIAFVPSFAVLALVAALCVGGVGAVVGASVRSLLSVMVCAAIGVVGGLVLNLPWSLEFGRAWSNATPVDAIGDEGLGVRRILGFDVGGNAGGALGVAVLAAVVVAPIIARGPRLAWAARGAWLAAAFIWLAVLGDRGSFGRGLPETSVLLAAAAVGVALSAGALLDAFQRDVMGGSFGFRQPLSLAAIAALGVGMVPGVFAVFDGRWELPRLTLQSSLGQLRPETDNGDYRVLWIGDPRLMPVAGWEYQEGLAYAIADDGPLFVDNAFTNGPTAADLEVREVLGAVARQETLRGGRLLAPFGIRYVVVPLADDAVSDKSSPLPVADGLSSSLEDQLDLSRALAGPLYYRVYENTAWIPTVAALSADGAVASKAAGFDAIAQSDASGAVPVASGVRLDRGVDLTVQTGTLHVGVPFDERWSLTVDGNAVAPRASFGTATAFDVAAAGRARLEFATPVTRRVLVVIQVLLWLLVTTFASRSNALRWFQPRSPQPPPLQAEPGLAMTELIVRPGDLGSDDEVPWADSATLPNDRPDSLDDTTEEPS